jgi:hypothetical protein
MVENDTHKPNHNFCDFHLFILKEQLVQGQDQGLLTIYQDICRKLNNRDKDILTTTNRTRTWSDEPGTRDRMVQLDNSQEDCHLKLNKHNSSNNKGNKVINLLE